MKIGKEAANHPRLSQMLKKYSLSPGLAGQNFEIDEDSFKHELSTRPASHPGEDSESTFLHAVCQARTIYERKRVPPEKPKWWVRKKAEGDEGVAEAIRNLFDRLDASYAKRQQATAEAWQKAYERLSSQAASSSVPAPFVPPQPSFLERHFKKFVIGFLLLISLLLGAQLARGQTVIQVQDEGTDIAAQPVWFGFNFTGGGITCTLNGTTGFVDCNVPTGGGGASWDAITNPVANQVLSMGAFTTAWTWNAATGAANLITISDTLNNTGTGVLLSINTASGSTAIPVRFTAGGTANGVQLSTAGVLAAIGSGSIQADDLVAATINALTDFDSTLCGTNELLEDQGASWACLAKSTLAASGANTDITSLGGLTGSILTPTLIDFDTAVGAPAHNEGQVFYDNVDKALAYHNDEIDVTLQIGQEEWVRVRNISGATINNGQVVYISGVDSGLPTIALAKADATATATAVGLATHSIENLTNGYVTITGVVHDFDTSAFTVGDTVYLSAATAGALTATPPSDPNFVVPVGTVTESNLTTGDVFVSPTQPRAIGGNGISVSGLNISTNSLESQFIKSSALGCGAGTSGQTAVATTVLNYCDFSGTPVQRFAAFGDSSGNALSGDTFASFFPGFSSADLRGSLTDEVGTGAAMFGLASGMSDDLACTGSQVVRRNAGDTAFECATISGGSSNWEDLTNTADTATSYTSNNTAETVTFSFEAAFAAATQQFLIRQQTGNPTGGTLLDVRAADTNVTVFRAGDGTNGITVSQAGALTAEGTGAITATLGDSATAFFGAGQIEAARGGTGDDTSATTGVPRITSGNWTYDAGISHLASSTSADLRGVLSDEVGTGAAMFGLISTMSDDLACTGSQVVRRNAGDTAFECATLSGGGAAWSELTAPTAATTFVSDATIETADFDFQAAFTTGNQFAIRQTTGNPTGGTLFAVLANDAQVTPLSLFQNITGTVGLEIEEPNSPADDSFLDSPSLQFTAVFDSNDAAGVTRAEEPWTLFANATADQAAAVASQLDIAVGGTAQASVKDTGVLDVLTGFTIGGAAATGDRLRGNGTNFVADATQLAGVGSCTNQFVTATVNEAAPTCTTATLASAQFANQGTTTTLLHGNAAGNPSFGAAVSADLNITTTSCTNQFVTAISSGAVGTCTSATLASAQFANQGTTTTVLHGNAAGNPSFAAVNLANDVTGNLALASLPVGTANQLIKTNAGATSQEHATLSGVASETDVTFGAGTITIGIVDPLATGKGGTGQNSTATFPTSGTVTTDAGTSTFTNKTYDVEGTGNTLTTVGFLTFPFAVCSEGTAFNNWDAPTGGGDTAPTEACNDTGSIQRPSADFSGSAVNGVEITFPLPDDWTGNLDFTIRYVTVAAAPTGNVEWDVSTVCRAAGESWDAAFNAAQTITDAVGSQNALNDATQTTLTITGCAAGEDMTIKVQRDGVNDTNNDLAKALWGRLKYRRAQ